MPLSRIYFSLLQFRISIIILCNIRDMQEVLLKIQFTLKNVYYFVKKGNKNAIHLRVHHI